MPLPFDIFTPGNTLPRKPICADTGAKNTFKWINEFLKCIFLAIRIHLRYNMYIK